MRFLIAWFVAVLLASPAPAQPSPSLLILNARVIDGTSAPARTASVRIADGRITAIGDLERRGGEAVLDARGRVLAPGFIDTHSHHDRGLAASPDALPVLSQGITTIVVGQDGSSARPLAELFAQFERSPAAINLAAYVGHGTIRAAVMGEDYRRAATIREIVAMQALLRGELDAGALGLSTGLEYDPGIYSTPAEVLALARTTAALGGRYISHMRSEDRNLWAALEEIIEIGRLTQMPVQVSHIKIGLIDSWGQADRLVARLDAARAQGVDITADLYPYEFWQSTLTVMFPERNFQDRQAAEYALRSLARPEGLRLSLYQPDPSLVGRTVAEIAAMRGTDPAATLMALIAAAPEPGSESVIGTSMDPRDIATLLRWPHSNIASDGSLASRHPRGAGSFTRVLRQYVREERVLSLEQAVHRMTGLSAAHMGFADRGVIRAGARADLVLFDPATVSDHATIENPAALSTGIDRVWVNGILAYAEGAATGARPGQVIRRANAAASPIRRRRRGG
jgi:N-acyl-D-amino-acid deacylase